MQEAKVSRNIRLFYVFRILNLPFFWLPILYIYLTQVKGFSVWETTFLLSLQELLMIFLEIPTGVVADKVSRRFSVALGYITTSLPFVFLPLTGRFDVIIGLFVIKAVGKALISGADSSLLYDTLADGNRQGEYKKITTRANAWMMVVAALAMLGGGYLGQLGHFDWAFYFPVPLQIAGAIAVILMYEPDISRKAKALQEQNYLSHIWVSAKSVAMNKKILIYVFLFGLFEGTAVNMKWYYPAIFENLGFTLILTGGVMAALYFGKSLLGLFGTRLIHNDPKENLWRWTIILTLAWMVTASTGVWPVVVLGLTIVGMGVEFLCSVTEELLHAGMESSTRATAMSFVNLISSIIATLLLWGWGAMLSIGKTPLALWSQVIIFGLAVGLIWWKRSGDKFSSR